MKKPLISSVATILMLLAMGALTACSSSPKGDDEIPLDDGGMAAPDAETDAVPQSEPETLTGADAPADLSSPEATPPAEQPAPPAIAEAAPAPAPMSAPTGETQDYRVQQGDTLMKIAFETYGDLYRWKDIYETNRDRIPDSNALVAGTVLHLEKPSVEVVIERNGEKYLIKRGDTLGTISSSVYGTPSRWKEIWNNNRQLIQNPNRIFAGFYLYYVPDEGGVKEQPQVSPAPLAQPAPSQQQAAPVPQEREPAAADSFDASFAPPME